MVRVKNTPCYTTVLFSVALLCTFAGIPNCPAHADEATAKVSRDSLVEPVFRVTKQETATTSAQASLVKPSNSVLGTAAPKPHPLDGALKMAKSALGRCQGEIFDYTAIIVKRERIDGRLNDEAYMSAKVRHEKRDANGNVEIPFSVYLKFLKPGAIKGREVIYVDGQNKGKLIAHEGGFKGKFTPSLYLDPNGTLAMMGQRYPITDIGIENLCRKLLERGGRDRGISVCQVSINDAQINGRSATRIEVVHPEKKPGLDFHVARIFVDKEHQIPVRYEAYDWPLRTGDQVSKEDLIEEYTYVRLKFNVGLTDSDFNKENPKYNM